MLLKRIDETLRQGLYDLEGGPEEVEVSLVEPSIGNGLVNWSVVREGVVPREMLHYDDTADISNEGIKSWKRFYAHGAALSEAVIYSGSSFFFFNGSPNFKGVAKSAIYLRYSKGFIDWLSGFDSGAAKKLGDEAKAFEKLETKEEEWSNFKASSEKWPLIVVVQLSDGHYIVHWLNQYAKEAASLETLGIDVPHSRELMNFLTAPATSELKLIAKEFQIGSGLGRNAFDKKYDLDAIRHSEYLRLMGASPKSSRAEILDLWSNKLEYQLNPSPDTSTLIFLPEGDLKYSALQKIIDKENEKKDFYFNAKKQVGKSGALKVPSPQIIPTPYSTTIFLTSLESKKRIIHQIFPDISLEYLQVLNAELLRKSTQTGLILQEMVVDYMKLALTGYLEENEKKKRKSDTPSVYKKRDTPSVYRYWTEIFTNALRKQPISAWEVFANFQRFAKSQSGETLIGNLGACRYFQVMGKLLRLQHLIVTAREDHERLLTNEFQLELVQVEQFNHKVIRRGVFGSMSSTTSGEELIGEAYGLLRDKQRSKLDHFIQQARACVPKSEFAIFVRGALAGMLLSELCWFVQQEGRHFSATQGRHPSRLRGRELQAVFNKGLGLLMNLDKAQLFNCRLLPFLKSIEPESRRESFNNGLISGMVYRDDDHNKVDDHNEGNEVKHD